MKTIGTFIIASLLMANLALAQDTLYVYKAGEVIYEQLISNIDSVTFKKNTTVAGTVTDIDGNVYHTVIIGTQTWMAENLKTTKYRYGGEIPNVSETSKWANMSTGAYCNYNNVVANGLKYGRLYNWYAVNDSPIAPTGWHVATDDDWETLIEFLISHGGNFDGTTIDNKIAKSLAATTDWKSDTGAGTIGNDLTTNNKSGFTALPGSFRESYGSFSTLLGYWGEWWSSTYYQGMFASGRYLIYSSKSLSTGGHEKVVGLSVRCVKD